MRPRALIALVVTAVAAFSLPGQAAVARSDLGVTARFDRRSVLPGQVAVAEVTVRNRGPEASGTATLALTASGGTILRTRARGGRCAAPRAGTRVRCTAPVTAFGNVSVVTVHIRAEGARAVAIDARVSSPGDPNPRDNRSAARVLLSRAAGSPSSELSFVFEAPALAVVDRPFSALLRILNRGPRDAGIGRIALTTSPSVARVRLSPIPQRLNVGAERSIVARVTATRPGRVVLDLRVGRTGRARLAVTVRPAAEG